MTTQQPAGYGHSQLPDGTWTWDSRVPAGQWQPYAQPRQGPAVTKQTLTGAEHIVHAILTFCTAGLWAPVWIIRAARGRRTVTYR